MNECESVLIDGTKLPYGWEFTLNNEATPSASQGGSMVEAVGITVVAVEITAVVVIGVVVAGIVMVTATKKMTIITATKKATIITATRKVTIIVKNRATRTIKPLMEGKLQQEVPVSSR